MTTETGGVGGSGRMTWEDLGRPGEKMAMGVPPFHYTVQVPPGWKVLRPTEELRRDLLTGMATQAGLAGAVLTAADTGVDRATGELLMGSLSLAWVRTSPIEADSALAEMMANGSGEVRQFAGQHSVCVLQTAVATPGSSRSRGRGAPPTPFRLSSRRPGRRGWASSPAPLRRSGWPSSWSGRPSGWRRPCSWCRRRQKSDNPRCPLRRRHGDAGSTLRRHTLLPWPDQR